LFSLGHFPCSGFSLLWQLLWLAEAEYGETDTRPGDFFIQPAASEWAKPTCGGRM
jgi:hypothetical protein